MWHARPRRPPPSLPGSFVALLVLEFPIGAGGHVHGSRRAVASGLALVMLATVLLPLAAHLREG